MRNDRGTPSECRSKWTNFDQKIDKLRRLKREKHNYNVILRYFRGIARWFRGHLISELIRRTDLHDCDWPEYDSLVEEKKIMKNSEKIPETKSFTEKLEETKKKTKRKTVPDFHVCPRLPRLSGVRTVRSHAFREKS